MRTGRPFVRTCVITLLAVCLASTARGAVPANVERSDPLHRCIVVGYRLTSPIGRAAKDVDCYFFLPQNEPRQQIHELRFDPKPAEITTDEHGRRIARFHIPRIAVGEHRVVRWMARVTTFRTKVYVDRPAAKQPPELTGSRRKTYLLDRPPYRLSSPTVRRAAAAVGPADLPVREAVLGIRDHVYKTVRYELSGGWDHAETVLRRGSGSCSEISYAFIAMCRARGIPARYVGGTTYRPERTCSFDEVQHRWAEAFLDGVGWVPIDVRRRSFVGPNYYSMASQRLVLGRGDGADDAPLRWSYTLAVRGKVAPRAAKEFFWCPPADAATFGKVVAAARKAGAGSGAGRGAAVRALTAADHPLAIPFLADLLTADDVPAAQAAAGAIRRLDEPAARRYRYTMRRSPAAFGALSDALAGAARGAPASQPAGRWVELFDGRRCRAGLAERGPFRVTRVGESTCLSNTAGRGMTLFDYRTPDRCFIELIVRHEGVGRAALVFGHVGRHGYLQLPLHVPEKPHVDHNTIRGIRKCPRGRYGLASGRDYRVLLAVDRHRVRFDLDGKTVLTVAGPVGPGRVGLTVWGKETKLQVKRLRVYAGPQSRPATQPARGDKGEKR